MTSKLNTVNASVTPIQREVNQFDALADVWWDDTGVMWPLHKLNQLRVPFISDAIHRHFRCSSLAELTVLDIGCGAGLLSEAMARLGAAVTGVDPAPRNIAMAKRHAKAEHLPIEYLEGDINEVKERVFDVVLNMEVIEHVDDLSGFMQACNAVVAPGGLHIVATLNRNLKSLVVAIVGAEYVLGWLPKGTHQWRQFVKPKELRSFLTDAGLSVLSEAGVAVNPFNRAYRITQNTSVNYMMVAERRA